MIFLISTLKSIARAELKESRAARLLSMVHGIFLYINGRMGFSGNRMYTVVIHMRWQLIVVGLRTIAQPVLCLLALQYVSYYVFGSSTDSDISCQHCLRNTAPYRLLRQLVGPLKRFPQRIYAPRYCHYDLVRSVVEV